MFDHIDWLHFSNFKFFCTVPAALFHFPLHIQDFNVLFEGKSLFNTFSGSLFLLAINVIAINYNKNVLYPALGSW